MSFTPSRYVPLGSRVVAVAGRSMPAKVCWFVGSAYLFLWVPDLDLALLPILHHRSIVTHSILPALLLIVLGRNLGAAPVAGGLIGIAVHLSCDLLSPMTGFAQIWLPMPIKMGLGPFSYLWLLANALVAYVWAQRIAVRTFPLWLSVPLFIATAAGTGVLYGIFNEQALTAVLVSLGILATSMTWGARYPSALR